MTTAAALGQRTIGQATFTISDDRTVQVTAEGTTYGPEQVQVMAALTPDSQDLPGWVTVALTVQAGLTHAPDLPVTDVLWAAGLQWRDRAALTQAPRFHPMLARDPHEAVRARLAQMTGMLAPTRDIQVLLARDPSWDVRVDLAKCGATLCEEAGLILARDPSRNVLFALAERTVHPEVLVTVFAAMSDEGDLLHTVLERRNGIPEGLWPLLAAHPKTQLRARAALSGFCPPHILDGLTRDTEPGIAQFATDTLARIKDGSL